MKGRTPLVTELCMRPWLFRRFIARRGWKNPVRLALLLFAIAAATTLVSSVVRVSLAGIASFESSMGLSREDYPLSITPRGGRLMATDVGPCLIPLVGSFDMVAYRREVGAIHVAQGEVALTVVGITALGSTADEIGPDDAILLSEAVMRELVVAEGDAVSVLVSGATISAGAQKLMSRGTTAFERSAVLPLYRLAAGRDGHPLDGVLLRPRYGCEPEACRRSLDEWIASCGAFSVPVQVDTVASRVTRGENLVAAYRFNVGVMALITSLVCALLVSQATQLSLRTLSRELSVLRTLGVGAWACLFAVIEEAALVGVLGGILGVTAGEPFTVWLTGLLVGTALDIYHLPLVVAGTSRLGEQLLVVVGMSCLAAGGAALGGLGALRISPSVGCRQEHSHVRWLPAPVVGRLAAISCLLALVVSVAAVVNDSALVAYLFVIGWLLAGIGVTPAMVWVTPWLMRLRGGGISVWMARGGLSIGSRGFLLGAVGASLSVAFIIALSLMVGSFRETLDGWAVQRLAGDLFVSGVVGGGDNEGRVPETIVAGVSGIVGVERGIPYYETTTLLDERVVVVSASDMGAQIDRGVFVLRAGSLNRAGLLAGSSTLVNESAARKLRLSVGDSLRFDNRTFSVVGIIQEFGTEHPMVMINTNRFLSMYPGHLPKNMTIDIQKGADRERVRQELALLVGPLGVVRDNHELRELVLALFDKTFRITLSVRWMVFGIGLLGIVLCSSQLLWERRRELKTMHVLGFSRAAIIASHVIEIVSVCTLPVVVGVVSGGVLGWGLTSLINPRVFGWSLIFTMSTQPLLVGVGFLGAVAIVCSAATVGLVGRMMMEATLADE